MRSVKRTILSISLVTLFLVGGLSTAQALPTPGFNGPEAEAVTGRVFPEALDTNDYIGFFEFEDNIRYLEEKYPNYIEIKEAGESYGLKNLETGAHDRFPVYMVEVTNEESKVAYEDKVQILVMVSIHGNEKGGREGGMRVIEDFAKGIGMAAWTNNNGAGNGTYQDYLDYMTLLFLFPNPDGWAHDEPQYLTSTLNTDNADPTNPIGAAFGTTGCANGVIFYCRTNGNNVDVNRETPTAGWSRPRHTALSEPEAQGYANFLLDNYDNLGAATDIHGMLNDDMFALTLLSAGQADPHKMLQNTRMAEMLTERVNNDPYFSAWSSFDESIANVWGGKVTDWGTVWDTIGYTDSGINGDWFFQKNGLDVPAFDIELAYNHLTFDSQYEVGAYFNDLHVHATRQIVGVMMDTMATDLKTSIQTQGTKTAVLANPVVVTNVDDEKPLGGWAAENEWDDKWDYAHNDFYAAPQDYWRDLKPFLADEDVPGVLDELNRVDLTAKRLANYDNLVIPGSAIQQIADDAAAVETILAWTEAGGNLVLTDSAMEFLELAGVVDEGAVDLEIRYAGYTNFFDRTHPLVKDVRGIARQLYEPVPLGFSLAGNHAPNWYVDRAALPKGTTELGYVDVPSGQQGTVASLTEEDTADPTGAINLGEIPLAEGRIRFIGALLPDPTEESYHPYGLESYATTYSGNQIMRAFLDWEQVFEAPPALLTDLGIVVSEKPTPDNPVVKPPAEVEESPAAGAMVAMTALVGLLGAAATLHRRRD